MSNIKTGEIEMWQRKLKRDANIYEWIEHLGPKKHLQNGK